MECFLEPSRHCACPSYVKSWPPSAASILSKPVSAISLPHGGHPGGVQTSQPISEAPGFRILHDANISGTCFIFWWCELLLPVGGGVGGRCQHCSPAEPHWQELPLRAGGAGFCQQPWVHLQLWHLRQTAEPFCFSPGKCKSGGHGQRSAGEPQLQKGRQEGL